MKFKDGKTYRVKDKRLRQYGRTFKFKKGKKAYDGLCDASHVFHFHDDFVLPRHCEEVIK